ncbi:MAG TPA: hypothetical protein VJL60_05925, partial [Gammaproteobacteria bacterium]|nr:hypothetical protein [Gammaproteobacteria bacterium]
AFSTAAMEAKRIGKVENLLRSDKLLGEVQAWIASDTAFLVASFLDVINNFVAQECKLRAHRLAAAGDAAMTIGALFGLLSMAIESLAKEFLIPSIVFFAPAFLIKYFQEVVNPYLLSKTKSNPSLGSHPSAFFSAPRPAQAPEPVAAAIEIPATNAESLEKDTATVPTLKL